MNITKSTNKNHIFMEKEVDNRIKRLFKNYRKMECCEI